jgi:hypothetical protein
MIRHGLTLRWPRIAPQGAVFTVLMRILATTAAVAIAALAATPAAHARKVKDLWATVNVCDTAKSPDDMGVRARAPGDASRAQIYMRFTAQYRTGGKWKLVRGGQSKWLRAGSARFLNQEIGYTFNFNKPEAGRSYVMRGLVRFQWRDKRKRNGKVRRVVVRREHRYTEGGHPTQGAEPSGFSAAHCTISTPPKPAGG